MKASENPFRSAEIGKLRYRIKPQALEALAMRVIGSDASFGITGPEGTGKTTLLEDLREKIEALGHPIKWLRLTNRSTGAERRAVIAELAKAAPGTIHLLDGGEVLGGLDWWRIRRYGRRNLRLIATLHRNRGLDLLHQTRPDWELTHALIKTLHHDDQLSQVARRAFETNRGNVREVFRACYWTCAKR